MCASVKTSPPETPTTRCEVPTKSNGRGTRSGGGERRKKIETRRGRCTPGQAGNDYIVRERSAKWLQLRLLLEDLGQVSLFSPFLLSSFPFLSPYRRYYFATSSRLNIARSFPSYAISRSIAIDLATPWQVERIRRRRRRRRRFLHEALATSSPM